MPETLLPCQASPTFVPPLSHMLGPWTGGPVRWGRSAPITAIAGAQLFVSHLVDSESSLSELMNE